MRRKRKPQEFKTYLELKIDDKDLVKTYRILYERGILPPQRKWDFRSKKCYFRWAKLVCFRWRKLIQWFVPGNRGNRLRIHKKLAEMMIPWGIILIPALIFIAGIIILELLFFYTKPIGITRQMFYFAAALWILSIFPLAVRSFFMHSHIHRTFLREEALFPSLKNMVNAEKFLVDEAVVDLLAEIPSSKLEKAYRSIDYKYGLMSDNQRTSAFIKLLSIIITGLLLYFIGLPKEVSGDLTKQLALIASVLLLQEKAVEVFIYMRSEETIVSYRKCKYLIKEAKEIRASK